MLVIYKKGSTIRVLPFLGPPGLEPNIYLYYRISLICWCKIALFFQHYQGLFIEFILLFTFRFLISWYFGLHFISGNTQWHNKKIQALTTQRRINLADVSNQDARISSGIHCLDSIDTVLSKFRIVNESISKISHPSEKYYICKRLHIHRQLTAK